MNVSFWLAYRYLRAKRKSKFIKIVTYITVAGVMVGVSALIIVIAVMNGFDSELEKKIIGLNAHLILRQDPYLIDYENICSKLNRLPFVISSAPFSLGNATVLGKELLINVMLKGIEYSQEKNTTALLNFLKRDIVDLKEDEIIIGNVLAEKLGLKIGDRIEILIPQTLRSYFFKVKGIFSSGMYEYDLSIAFLNLKKAQKILGLGKAVSGIGIKISNPYQAQRLKDEIARIFGYPYYLLSWIDMNKNLFSALKLEKTAMFIILALIVLVASFNISSILIMSVLEKVRDIGVLKAIGMNKKKLMGIFIWEGMLIGFSGILLGSLLGFSAIYLLKNYPIIKLPPDIYYIDRLPVKLTFQDSFLIISCAFLLSFLSTIYPARRAAKLDPIVCLRYE